MNGIARSIALAGAMLLATGISWLGTASANPAFDDASGGKPCSACHQSGREAEIPTGLNSTGMTVYLAFQSNGPCHMKIGCAVQAAFPSYSPAPSPNPPAPYVQPQPYSPAPTQAASFLYRFYDHCVLAGSYFVVRLGGSPTREARFLLKNGHEIRMDIPDGSLWASSCGGWPGANATFKMAHPND
jgi:hypothetical protein